MELKTYLGHFYKITKWNTTFVLRQHHVFLQIYVNEKSLRRASLMNTLFSEFALFTLMFLN